MRAIVIVILAAFLLYGCAGQPARSSQPPQPPEQNQSQPQPPAPNNSPLSTGLAISEGPELACALFDSKAGALGIGGADLGVPLVDGNMTWLIFGDTSDSPAASIKGPTGIVGSSSVVGSGVPFDCSNFSWVEAGGRFYQPLVSKRTPGSDESTVPAGGITLNGTRYIYSMRVDHWAAGANDTTHAHGVLFRQEGPGPFKEVAQWPLDAPFVNAAPVFGQLDNGTQAVFLALSGPYRKSPVYLAYVLPEDITNSSRYRYLSGYGPDGSPEWTGNASDASPLVDGVWAGELSLAYDRPLGEYLLMFFDHKARKLDLYYSGSPYGPFSGPLQSEPCGASTRPSWMQPGWGGCYGGYIIPDDFGADGHDLYYTLSLWDPYATFVMKERLASG